jgi:hypothetical protein
MNSPCKWTSHTHFFANDYEFYKLAYVLIILNVYVYVCVYVYEYVLCVFPIYHYSSHFAAEA